ncbi:MAG: hypothetical protein AAFR79_12405, partial [Pseudomonadota bacterium]
PVLDQGPEDQETLQWIVCPRGGLAEREEDLAVQQLIAEAGVAAIAKREGLSRHRITQLLDLAFLAPEIVEAITQGTQPVNLTASRLIKRPIPVLWSEQRSELALG